MSVSNVPRDKHQQYAGEWTPTHYQLLNILEDIAGPVEDDDQRTLSVFMADILDLLDPNQATHTNYK